MNPEVKVNDIRDNHGFHDFHSGLFRAVTDGCVGLCQQIEKLVSKEKYLSMKSLVNTPNDSGETLLAQACRCGNLELVSYLVRNCEADVNQAAIIYEANRQESTECKPLHAAVMSENVELVRFLVEKCPVDVNAITGVTKRNNRFFKSKFCIQITDQFKQGQNTPLHYAAMYLDGSIMEDIVICLVQNGADFRIRNKAGKVPCEIKPFNQYKMSHHVLSLHDKLFLLDKRKECDKKRKFLLPMFVRFWIGGEKDEERLKLIRTLSFCCVGLSLTYLVLFYKAGSNIIANFSQALLGNSNSIAPLHAAVIARNFDLVKFLVEERNADVNAKLRVEYCYWNKLNSSPTFLTGGNTPLHCAISVDSNSPICHYLIHKGADAFIQNQDGQFPWEMTRTFHGKLSVLKSLIRLGLNIDRQIEPTLETLAHQFIKQKNHDALELLCNVGADLTLRDMKGTTPLIAAVQTECDDITKKRSLVDMAELIFDRNNDQISVEEKIAFLEYKGAKRIVLQSQDFNPGLYWREANELRSRLPPNQCSWRNDRETWPDYFQIAFQRIPEIENRIGSDDHELSSQAILTVYRYRFGIPPSKQFIEHLYTCAKRYFDAKHYHHWFNFDMATIKCCQLTVGDEKSYTVKPYETLGEMFFTLAKGSTNFDGTYCFSNILAVLKELLHHLKLVARNDDQLSYDINSNNVLFNCFIKLSSLMLAMEKSEEENFQMKRYLVEFIKFERCYHKLGREDTVLRMICKSWTRTGLLNGIPQNPICSVRSIIRLLIELGVDPDLVVNDLNGDTVLHCLARDNHQWNSPVIEALLESGANPYILNFNQQTVHHLICKVSPRHNAILVHPQYFPSLKCFAARVVSRNGLDSSSVLPTELQSYVEKQSNFFRTSPSQNKSKRPLS